MLSDEALIRRAENAKLTEFIRHRGQSIAVLEDNYYRWLTIDGVVQSIMDKQTPPRLLFAYQHKLVAALPPSYSSVIELGLGGGSLFRQLATSPSRPEYYCIEHNPHIIRWFHQFFNPEQVPLTLYQVDANELPDSLPIADVVIADLYSNEGSPAFLFQQAFYKNIQKHCKKSLILNILPRTEKELTQVISLLKETFQKIPEIEKIAGMKNYVIVVRA